MFAIPAVVHCTLLHAGTDTKDYGASPPSKSAPTLLGCPFRLVAKNSFLPKGLRQLFQPGIPNWDHPRDHSVQVGIPSDQL